MNFVAPHSFSGAADLTAVPAVMILHHMRDLKQTLFILGSCLVKQLQAVKK